MTYFWEVDLQADALASQAGVVYARLPGDGVFGLSLAVGRLFGLPKFVDVTGVFIDVQRVVTVPSSKSGDTQAPVNFVTADGTAGSGMEHGIIEQFYGVEAISAVKAIQLANAQGLKTYNITSANVAAVLPVLQVSSAVKTDITNAVNAGKEVTIPEQDLVLNDWTGIGYIVSDPLTGAGAYVISGGIGGGSGTVIQSLSNVLGQMLIPRRVLGCLASILHAILTFILISHFIARTLGFLLGNPVVQAIVSIVLTALLIFLIVNVIRACLSLLAGFMQRRDKSSLGTAVMYPLAVLPHLPPSISGALKIQNGHSFT